MILVDGDPFAITSSQGGDMCNTLMKHHVLVSAACSLKAMQEQNFSLAEESGSQMPKQNRWVYIFQREYATVDPGLVDYIGTDEATTCVGLVIRNRVTKMTSVAHMDSPKVVDIGLTQMLSAVVDHTADVDLDHANGTSRSDCNAELDGYSFPLCAKIIEALGERRERFHLQTLFVLGHNTKWDSQGNAYPVFTGFMVETSTGSIIPARFDRTTRCPDEIVRRIRVCASYEDLTWNGKLLETYDTQADQFVVAACSWTMNQLHVALTLQHLSEVEILLSCSTSPFAEAPDFVDNERRKWDYLIKHPDWRYTFPERQPHIFKRAADGGWERWSQTSQELVAENSLQTS